jgi:hypothetical protein
MSENTAYEAQRAARIAANRAQMQKLGLLDASKQFSGTMMSSIIAIKAPTGKSNAPRPKKKSFQPPAPAARASKRLKGEQALPEHLSVDVAKAELQEEEEENDYAQQVQSYNKKRLAIPLQLDPNVSYAPPFTIRSINTTILDLGHVHRGEWAHRYWSNKGCLYHHAYPVGFKAQKEIFNRVWEMRIEEGISGPIFIVTDGKYSFRGDSPTAPWTKVCLAQKTGQRISGPLFFGFSDSITQNAIACCCYDEADRAAAIAGERLRSDLGPREKAAAEFETVEGIGEKVAQTLALTMKLGGRQHESLESLKSWCQSGGEQEGDNARTLALFLLESPEMPDTTKRWGPWRNRIAPKVVETLSGREWNSLWKKKKDSSGEEKEEERGEEGMPKGK